MKEAFSKHSRGEQRYGPLQRETNTEAEAHAQRSNARAQKSKLKDEIKALRGKMREHRENRLFPILDAWRVHRRLLNERSPDLLFYDLETSFSSKPGTNYKWVFQICMRDAARKTIVSEIISQGMTVNALYDVLDCPEWRRRVRKWYGPRSEEITAGIEWY